MAEGLLKFLRVASQGGGRNFRPVGDFGSMDGHFVPAGRVYRSGHLGELSADYRAQVEALGVRTVVSFQTRQEIEILGDPLPSYLREATWQHLPIGEHWFEEDAFVPGDAASQGEFYLAMVKDHVGVWARFLRLFTDQSTFSILYHCTAGRDRTGVATLLLLETLRVPRSEIVADYLASNRVFADHLQEAKVLQPLFHAIDQSGGIDPFIVDLGLEPSEIEAIRSNLLTPVRVT